MHAIYIYLIIGAWFAGMSMEARFGVVLSVGTWLFWPVILAVIWAQNRRYKRERGR